MEEPQIDEQTREVKDDENNDLNSNLKTVPDGGWGWFVSASAFVVQFMILGLQNNLGLFHVAHLEHFQKSKLETGWVSSLAIGNMYLFAPMTSALCERYGCRYVGIAGGLLAVAGMFASSFANHLYILYLTFGIVYGAGTSMCFFPTLRTLPYWFSRHLALANGIAAAGSGVGTVAMGPLLETLMSTLGWKITARILSGLLLIPVLAAMVYSVPKSSPIQRQDQPKPKLLDLSVFKHRGFIVLCVAMSFFMMCYIVPFVHMPRYAQDLNVSKTRSSYLLGIMSIVSTFSRLFFGKIADNPRVNRLYLCQMSFFFIGIADALVPQITNHTGFVVYMVSFGFFDGCLMMLRAILISDIVGVDKVSPGMGVMFFFIAIATFVGSPLAGWFIDIFGSYDFAFYYAGSTSVISSIILFLVPVMVAADARRHNGATNEVVDGEEMQNKEGDEHVREDLPRLTADMASNSIDSGLTSKDDSSANKSTAVFLKDQASGDPIERVKSEVNVVATME